MLRRIEDLVEGEGARVVGRIAAIDGTTIESPSGERCLYWDLRVGHAEPFERKALPFWVEDESGRVLVRSDETEVHVSGDPVERAVDLANVEIEAVSAEIRRVKELQRKRNKPEYPRRRRELAKIATLLCRVRAHARGNVHGKGTLASQKRWIIANQHLAQEGLGLATLRAAMDPLESRLGVGDEVVLEASFRREPLPAELGGVGYRERPLCLVATSLDGRRPLIVAKKLAEAALQRQGGARGETSEDAVQDSLDLSSAEDLRAAIRSALAPKIRVQGLSSRFPWWAPLALGLVLGVVLFWLTTRGC